MSSKYPTLFYISLLYSFSIPPAMADTAPARLMDSPPRLQKSSDESKPAKSKSKEFDYEYELFIRYTDGTIYNPSTGNFDKVRLRAYQQKTDKGWDAKQKDASHFLAPTVVMSPGERVRFTLHNQLPEENISQCEKANHNAPGKPTCFNVTNLHTHGLWISPSGNSDNVFVAINPTSSFAYEYAVPEDHPAGTFWYHPHTHGTTAMQVGSGMAGALVIKGDRYPRAGKDGQGDLDTLLKKFVPKGGVEKEVMLLEQIPYACFHKNADGSTDYSDPKYDCASTATGEVESFKQVGPQNAWKESGRYTMINGKVIPSRIMREKTLYRWRFIDAGFQATVALRIKKAKIAKLLEEYSNAISPTDDLSTICNGADITQFEVASDGLTHGKAIAKTVNYLQPGYRSDILFSLPESGLYCIYDDKSPDNLKGNAKSTRLMGVIMALPKLDRTYQNQAQFVTDQLIKAAKDQHPSVRAEVITDLKDGLKLSKFVPHASFTPEEVAAMEKKPKEYATFDIGSDPRDDKKTTLFMVKGNPADKEPNSEKFTYHPDKVNHTLVLGNSQIWELSSNLGSHPFHIHVNPFQVLAIKPPEGEVLDEQYKDLVGTWRDTLLVKERYKITIGTRYQRYIGDFVMHCHILEHEDQGMMQNVRVVPNNGKGAAAANAHGGH